MLQSGIWNKEQDLSTIGISSPSSVYWNYNEVQLYEVAIRLGEGQLAAGGALTVETGEHTGRSANDKFVVRTEETEDTVWWDANKAMTKEAFDLLLADMTAYTEGRVLYANDLYGGAHKDHRLNVRVITEKAWHSLFIRNLLIRPEQSELAAFVPEMTIINLPSFKADPERYGCRSETVIACDLTRKIVLIAGTSYAGEMKKSVFTMLNHHLPDAGIMPMHCSANIGDRGDAAVFFGLSGTGKTTLSADADRTLIGDDEHGWGPDGVFNFEGGCYAKTIRLSAEAEPQIFSTTQRFGTVLENVVLDSDSRVPDLDDGSKTENTRAAYPISFIENASPTGLGPQPKNLIFLTADAFGVLPPLAKLTPAQAMYHFISGYTAKVAGTEKGVSEPTATFSACFGKPFMTRHPAEYGALLKDLIAQHNVNCWLVNTGWTGGAFGEGSRMPIKATRALLRAALEGLLENAEFDIDPVFGLSVPKEVPGVDSALLDPRGTWADPEAYDVQAARLAEMFIDNFAEFAGRVDNTVITAGPVLQTAKAAE